MRMVVLFMLLGSFPAWSAEPREAAEVVLPKVTEIDFVEVDVRAKVERPSGVLLSQPGRPVFHPLIRLRTDFDDRIRDTASAR